MKAVVLVLVLVAVASAQRFAPRGQGFGAGRTAGGAAGGAIGPFQPRNWGPKVFGPGANNAFAFPANPILMQRALSIVNRVPNTLVFLDVDGEVSIRNRFGQEVEGIIDPRTGLDLTEFIEL